MQLYTVYFIRKRYNVASWWIYRVYTKTLLDFK